MDNNFSLEDIYEALEKSEIGVWRLEMEVGGVARFYGDHNMNLLLGVPDEMGPEERMKVFYSRVYPEDMNRFVEYKRSLAESEQAEVVYRYMHPTRGVIYVRCSGKRDNTASGQKCACYRGFHQNISSTLRIEQEKRKQVTEMAELYQIMSSKLMEMSSDSALSINLEKKTYEWIDFDGKPNEEKNDYDDMRSYFSCRMPEEYGKEFLDKTSLEKLRKELADKDTYSFVTYMYGENHSLRRIMFIYYAVSDSIVLSLSRDTTEEYRREQVLADALMQAKQANRAKTVFLNNMSHDIRTPMNAIIGFTNLAKKYIQDTERLSEYLDKISSSSEHLLELINDVLDMSRIESGKVFISETVCSISEIVNGLQTLLMNEANSRQLSFEVDCSGVEDDIVNCDKLRVNQVLMNCLSNALKFTNAGGRVLLKVTQSKDEYESCAYYHFDIEDTGIGMSPDFIEHIFEPFTRDESSSAHEIQGTGLGMAITKNLVDLMHGEIEVESKLGKGTKFHISLMFTIATKDEKDAAPKCDVDELDLSEKNILLVEDNDINREIALEILGDFGANVECAVNGLEAVNIVSQSEETHFDVILMDVQMPVMNGYESTKTIRGLEREDVKFLPIIAMTANAFEEDKQTAIASGMNDHIAKPINIPIFMATLSKYINKY